MKLYHGSQHIIEHPVYGQGKTWNDYGQAFYCTEDRDMAMEWACPIMRDGYANEYELDTKGLSLLDLTSEDYHILNWLAVLLENRTFSIKSDLAESGYRYITDTFGIDHKDYDLIKGYRADDSYFSFANAFLNNAISLSRLNEAVRLGQLGEQIAIKSRKAFGQLTFKGYESADGEMYFARRRMRDLEAREAFNVIRSRSELDGVYLLDILRWKWGNDDARL